MFRELPSVVQHITVGERYIFKHKISGFVTKFCQELWLETKIREENVVLCFLSVSVCFRLEFIAESRQIALTK